MNYYIYRIAPIDRHWSYVGQHKGNPDDSYMGNGKIPWISYRKHLGNDLNPKLLSDHIKVKESGLYTKEILALCSTKELADMLEILFIKRERSISAECLNIQDGGTGGFTSEQMKEIANRDYVKAALSERMKGHTFTRGRVLMNFRDKDYLIKPEEVDYYLSIGYNKGASESHKNNMRGKKHNLNYSKTELERRSKQTSLRNKGNKYAEGCRWMNNGEKSYLIPKNLIEDKLSNGYKFGRIKKK